AGSSYFSAHVTYSTFTGCTHRVGTFAKIFNDGTCTTFYSKLSCHPKDHIFCRRPAIELASQLNTYNPGHFQFPGQTSHHIHCIGATHTNRNHTQATCIGCVRVGTDHHTTGKCIVLKYHLVNDTCARFPETDSIFIGNGSEKIVNLLINFIRCGKVSHSSRFSLDQVIAVYSRWYSYLVTPGCAEL